MIDERKPGSFDFGIAGVGHVDEHFRAHDHDPGLDLDFFGQLAQADSPAPFDTINPSSLTSTPTAQSHPDLRPEQGCLEIPHLKTDIDVQHLPSLDLTATPTPQPQPQPQEQQHAYPPPSSQTAFNDFSLFPSYSPLPRHAFTAPQNSPAESTLSYPNTPSIRSNRPIHIPFAAPIPHSNPTTLLESAFHPGSEIQHQPFHGHSRAHSQPPEHIPVHYVQHPQLHPQPQPTFHRAGGVFLGRPRHVRQPYPHNEDPDSSPPRRNGAGTGGERRAGHPYYRPPLQGQALGQGQYAGNGRRGGSGPRAGMGLGPTSAPAPGTRMMAPEGLGCMRPASPRRRARGYSSPSRGAKLAESDSAVGLCGAVEELERISRDVDALKRFLRLAAGAVEEGEGEGEEGVDEEGRRTRADIRARNALVTSLDASLEPIATPDSKEHSLFEEEPVWNNLTGEAIRNWDAAQTESALEAHGIPAPANAFMYQRKEVFLRFIGVSRALMHSILD